MLLILQVREMSDLIVRDVEDSEVGIILEVRDLSQGIVGYVKFFQVGKSGKARDSGQAIRLYGKYLEVAEMRYVLLLYERRNTHIQRKHFTLISVILFFPNQSSSKPVKVSRFSSSCTTINLGTPSFWQLPYPYPVGSQFQIPQLGQPIKSLNLLYLVLHKVDVLELLEMIHILDMLDLVEA